MFYERIIKSLDMNNGELMLLALFVLLVFSVYAWEEARLYSRIRVIRIGKYRFARKIRK